MNYYSILNIEKSSSQTEIKVAYKKLCLLFHPDKHFNNKIIIEQFNKIKTAYEVLSSPFKKQIYDEEGFSSYYKVWKVWKRLKTCKL